MSTKENQTPGTPEVQNCPKAGDLIRELFSNTHNSEIQKAFDDLMIMAAESSTFGEFSGIQRSNVVAFVVSMKDYFAKAAKSFDKLKGGENAVN